MFSVGAYYPEGLNPVKIYVESKYVRAVRGGMGYAKTGGNYAASLKAQDEAEEQKIYPGVMAGWCGTQICGRSRNHECILL